MFNAQDFAARLSTRQDRWSLLKDFIAEWHRPLTSGSGYSAAELDAAEQRLELKLPEALRELYQFAGRWEDVFVATQNFLVSPEELEIEEGLLEIYCENQGIVHWGIRPDDLHLPDPPVYLNDSGLHDEPQEIIRENETLSGFALQMVVCDTTIALDRSILVRDTEGKCISILAGDTEGKITACIKRDYVRFDFADWHWPCHPVHFYGSQDTLAIIVADGSIHMAAHTHAAYVAAQELLESQ